MENRVQTDKASVSQLENAPSIDVKVEEYAIHRGADLLEEERSLGILATAKLHWRPLCISCVSFAAAMMYGYDNIANGSSIAMPALMLVFGEKGPNGLYLPSLWTSLWTSMSILFQAVGAFAAGFVQDRFGRKWTSTAFSALSIAGTGLQYASRTREELLGGKIINGFAIGGALAIATTYASEVAPLKLKAVVQQGLILFMVSMMCLALGIVRAFVPDVEPQAFRNVFAIQWAVGGLATLAFLFVPESPVYLIANERLEEAHKAMSQIYGSDKSIDARVAHLAEVIREEQAQRKLETGSYIDCFRGTDLKRTMSAIFLYTAQAWGGAAFLQQSTYVVITAGLPAVHAFDISIGGFAFSIILILVNWLFANRFRRRNAFISGCVINLVGMVIIAGLYYAPGKGPLWAIAILMNFLIAIQTGIIQAMGYPIAAEVSSYRLRGKTISSATIAQAVVNWGIGFAVPYMYNVGSGNLGPRTGFVFAGISMFLCAIAFYLVPDTTNMTAPEIDQAFADRVPPRKFGTRARSDRFEMFENDRVA